MKKKDFNKQNKLIPAGSSLLLYTTPDGSEKIEVRLENETVWLTQAGMAELFQTTAQNITIHLKEIYASGQLTEEATCKESLQVQPEGQIVVSRTRKLDAFLKFNEREILGNAGKVAKEIADKLALEQYEIFNKHRLVIEAEAESLSDDAALKSIEENIEKKRGRP